MRSLFFNEQGLLAIDEYIENHPSFKKIMEDGIVSDAELEEQTQKVISLFEQLGNELSAEQQELVVSLLGEMNVLQVVNQTYQLQNLQ